MKTALPWDLVLAAALGVAYWAALALGDTLLLLDDMSRPHAHECSIGPVLALFGLILGALQLFAIALLGPLLLALVTPPESANTPLR
jgi:hypothetical protein